MLNISCSHVSPVRTAFPFRLLPVAVLLIGLSALGEQPVRAANEPHVTHGPVLGRLSSDGVGIWARTSVPAEFAVLYGRSPNQLDQRSRSAKTRFETDNTGWIALDGLQARTRYYFELILVDGDVLTGRKGSFRTLPDSADYVDAETNPEGLFNFSFEFACGNNQNPGQGMGPSLPTFETMLRQVRGKVDFAILNGDWLYETQREFTVDQWRRQVECPQPQVPGILQAAPTLPGVWQNYKHFYDQAPHLVEWHSHVPTFFTFDDHEMLNDVWGAGSPGLRDRRAVFRDIGLRAWYDYLGWSNPTRFDQRITLSRGSLSNDGRTLTDESVDFQQLDWDQVNNLHIHWGGPTAAVNDNALDEVGGHPSAGVYRVRRVVDAHRLELDPPAPEGGKVSYSIGRRSYYRLQIANCDFFVLDTRGQRQMHDTKDPHKKGLSMLGPVQRQWLEQGVRASTADFIFVVSSVNFMVPHIGGGKVRTTNKDDAWTVFFDERESLIDLFDSLERPVMLLTGDLHNSFVIQITDNVWEFASGPHNSRNHLATDEGNRPPNGRFEYGPRPVDIRWSTYFKGDVPRTFLKKPMYCVVQLNNVFENPTATGGSRWVRFPRPQVIFQYYDGRSGKLEYAESILARPRPAP